RQPATIHVGSLESMGRSLPADDGLALRTVQDREDIVAGIVESARRMSLTVTPPELASSPTEFRREDGSSRFRPQPTTIYTSEDLLAAEDRLLARAEDRTAPIVRETIVSRTSRARHHGNRLTDEQAAALANVAVSGR